MDEENMYIAFRNLEINEKRNLYNEEVVKLYELLKNINGNSTEQSSVLRNYNINTDSGLTEEEYLSYEFENIIKLREQIIKYIASKNKSVN